MKPFKLSRLLALLALLLGALPLTHIQAQDGEGLSAEEQAALERAYAALASISAYQSYVLQETGEFSMSFHGLMDGEPADQTIFEERALQTRYVLLDEVPNMQTSGQVLLLDTLSELSYGYSAEVRLVEGIFYATASTTDEEETDISFPDGWFELEPRSDAWFDLAALPLAAVLGEGQPFDLPAGRFEAVSDTINVVALESDELADGTPLELIQIFHQPAGLVAWFADEDGEVEPFYQAIADYSAGQGLMVLSVGLDEQEQLRLVQLEISLVTEEFDYHEVEEQSPPGQTVVSIGLAIEYRYEFSELNADLAPVAAPQME